MGEPGFNRQLRLAERRRSTQGDATALPPAVVLDDVDGDVLEVSPNRVSGSPVVPSPQRFSIPRTPVSARSHAERPLPDSGPTSLPRTPSSTTKATSVEVLFCGTMRTADSGWFDDGEAWFPAELLGVHHAPASGDTHPAFEPDAEKTVGQGEEQVWVQVAVPVLREQPIIWVKIQAVRPVRTGGVLPTRDNEPVEVSEALDGRFVWYRGAARGRVASASSATLTTRVQLYGRPRGGQKADSRPVADGGIRGAAEESVLNPASGPTIVVDSTTSCLRCPMQGALTVEEAVEMVRGAKEGAHAMQNSQTSPQARPIPRNQGPGDHAESKARSQVQHGCQDPLDELTGMVFDLDVACNVNRRQGVWRPPSVSRGHNSLERGLEAAAGRSGSEAVGDDRRIVAGKGHKAWSGWSRESLAAFADLLCEREAASLAAFAHGPDGFQHIFNQAYVAAASLQQSADNDSGAGGKALQWSEASATAARAFAQVCIEHLDHGRAEMRVDAMRALLVAVLGLPGEDGLGWWDGSSRNGLVKDPSALGERKRAKWQALARARASSVLEAVSDSGCIHLLLHSLCRATQYGSRVGEGLSGPQLSANDSSSQTVEDDGDLSSGDESRDSEDWGLQTEDWCGEDWYGEGTGMLRAFGQWGCKAGESDDDGGAESGRQVAVQEIKRAKAAQMMRVEACCSCNLMFLVLSHLGVCGGSAGPQAAKGKGGVGHGNQRAGAWTGGARLIAEAVLSSPSPVAGGSKVPCLLVVVAQLLYRAGLQDVRCGRSRRWGRASHEDSAARKMGSRFPVPYKKLLCLLQLVLSQVLSLDQPSLITSACPAASPHADLEKPPATPTETSMDTSAADKDHESYRRVSVPVRKCSFETLRRWTTAMLGKYPTRAPAAVVEASNLLRGSLSRWPGLPSVPSSPSFSSDGADAAGAAAGKGSGLADRGRAASGLRLVPVPQVPWELEQSPQDEDAGGGSDKAAALAQPVSGQARAADQVYGVLVEHLPSLVVGLLKLILAAGVNSAAGRDHDCELHSPPVHDMPHDVCFDSMPARRAQAPHDRSPSTPADGRPPHRGRDYVRGARAREGCGLASEEEAGESAADAGAEWKRYRRVVCGHAPAVLLLLLKRLRYAHYLQAEYLACLLCDSNYLLLALKSLNVDCERALRLPSAVRGLDETIMGLLCPTSRILSAVAVAAPSDLRVPALPQQLGSAGATVQAAVGWGEGAMAARRCRRRFQGLVSMVRVLLRCCKHSRLRTRTLLTYKAPAIIRKALAVHNPQLTHYVLSLFKSVACQLSRKWKTSNSDVVTLIFLQTKPTMHADYLAPDPVTLDELQEEDATMRHATDTYNRRFYRRATSTRNDRLFQVARLLESSEEEDVAPDASARGEPHSPPEHGRR